MLLEGYLWLLAMIADNLNQPALNGRLHRTRVAVRRSRACDRATDCDIDLKMKEVTRFRAATLPMEYQVYYAI